MSSQDQTQNYSAEFAREQKQAVFARDQVSKYRRTLEQTLNYMGSENLRKLKDLRDNAEVNPTDLFVFIEQLHAQNQAFNFKDKFKQLEGLSYLLNEPYFSRIDLLNEEEDHTDTVYIGKFGLTESSSAKPLITDWRAKIASVYYKYRYPQKDVVYDTQDGRVTRDLLLKRTFEFDNGELLKYYNNDIQLDEDEIIGAKIAKRTGGVLEDIVATIQQSQMEIIEQDPRGVCIVQGCVGSGKSTVAIHKLSHIFFNYPNTIRPQNSLLIAKNQILVGYLSTLFPKLGIFDINYGTLKDMIIRVTFGHEMPIKLNLDDETRMDNSDLTVVNTLRKCIQEVRTTLCDQMSALSTDPIFSSYFTFVYDEDVSAQENLFALVEELQEETKFQKEKLESGITGIAEIKCQDNIKNLKKAISEIRKISTTLRSSKFPALIKQLGIDRTEKLSYRDALIYVYLYSEFFGLSKFQKFEYCVVDEGQDFSPLEYLLLNNLVIRGRFCILGDLNQSYLKSGLGDWHSIEDTITEARACKKFELTTNYRSTKPIIDYACSIITKFSSEYLPGSINRRGVEVIERNISREDAINEVTSELEVDLSKVDKSIGIICFDNEHFDQLRSYLEHNYRLKLGDKLVVLDPKDRVFYTPKGVYLTMFSNCKGLEFAKAYVLGANKSPKDLYEAKMNYVAVTRAMNELVVFYY